MWTAVLVAIRDMRGGGRLDQRARLGGDADHDGSLVVKFQVGALLLVVLGPPIGSIAVHSRRPRHKLDLYWDERSVRDGKPTSRRRPGSPEPSQRRAGAVGNAILVATSQVRREAALVGHRWLAILVAPREEDPDGARTPFRREGTDSQNDKNSSRTDTSNPGGGT